MRWVETVARMVEIRNAYTILIEKPKRGDHLESIDRGIISYLWILKKDGVKMWTGFIWLRIGASGGLL
jgi:hypothetical protein